MGIQGLTKVITEHAKNALKEYPLKQLSGKKIAFDANLTLYQFLCAVRLPKGGGPLSNREGQTTSHLQGLFYKTVRLMANGVKPIFVFDGKPPEKKVEDLRRRRIAKKEAKQKIEETKNKGGDAEEIDRLEVRSTWLTFKQSYEAKKLLYFMGIPCIQAPSEAEAQCAAIAKSGNAYAVGSEDMDSLAFGSPVLVRKLAFQHDVNPFEICLKDVLKSMGLTKKQFLDLCILLGCDYCEPIKGVGPVRAIELIKKYGTIEDIIPNLDKRYEVPSSWTNKKDVNSTRKMFTHPNVLGASEIDPQLYWDVPDADNIVQMLVHENQFNEERVLKSVHMLKAARKEFPEPGQLEYRKNTDPPPPSPDSERQTQFENQLLKFLRDERGPKELVFPSTLTSYERYMVHSISGRLGLLHVTQGDPDNRHVLVTRKPETKTEPPLEEDTFVY